ncbi:MAG: GIY-YIG nuclease family protein [Candidatus Sulfotelmatobacter sp.]
MSWFIQLQRSAMPKARKKRGTRGRLIKGIAKLPASLFENSFFTPVLQTLLSKSPGIYALYKGEDLYYVGLSNNLKSRIKQHLKDKHSRRWDTFKIFKIRRVNYLKDMETVILQIARPEGNRQTGKLPAKQRHALTKRLKAALNKMETEAVLIRKALK